MRLWRTFYAYLKHAPAITLVAGAFLGWYLQAYVFDKWLPQWGLGGPVVAPILIVGALAMLVLMYAGWDQYRTRRRELPQMGKAPAPRQGLIMLLGKSQTAEAAIAHHQKKLTFVWYIVTLRTQDTPAQLWRHVIDVHTDDQLVLDPWRPAETANAVDRAISHALTLGMSVDDVICDITGGTTAMTYGAIEACRKAGIALEMVPAEYDVRLKAMMPMGVILLENS